MLMRCLLSLFLWFFALPLAAQPVNHACSSVPEPAARLACYDEEFPPPPEVNEIAARKAQADFGLNKPREPLRNPGQIAEQVDQDRVNSRVAKVDYGQSGRRSFTLENGHVWIQTDSSGSGYVEAGDIVQVRKGMLSGFLLVTPDGVALRVRRMR